MALLVVCSAHSTWVPSGHLPSVISPGTYDAFDCTVRTYGYCSSTQPKIYEQVSDEAEIAGMSREVYATVNFIPVIHPGRTRVHRRSLLPYSTAILIPAATTRYNYTVSNLFLRGATSYSM